MLSHQLKTLESDRKSEISQNKWSKRSNDIGINYKNKEEKSHLREINGYVEDDYLIFYIRIYHDPEPIKVQNLISQLDKKYHEKIAKINNENMPRLTKTEKKYNGQQYTQIDLTTSNKRCLSELIHILNVLFDIREIYADLCQSFKINPPFFNDFTTIKTMVNHKAYVDAIASALETSEYLGHETTLYDLGKYFEEIGNVDLALKAYKQIPEQNICFAKAQEIIAEVIAKKKLENKKRYADAKETIHTNIGTIKAEILDILKPYLGIKKVNESIEQLIHVIKKSYKAIYLEDEDVIGNLKNKIEKILIEISLNLAIYDFFFQRNKILEKVSLLVNMHFINNPSVDKIALRKKVNEVTLSYIDGLSNIDKIGKVSIDTFEGLSDSFIKKLAEFLPTIKHNQIRKVFVDGEIESILKQIIQCVNRNLKNKKLLLNDGSKKSNNDENSYVIRLTDFPNTLFRKTIMQKDDKENKLSRSLSF